MNKKTFIIAEVGSDQSASLEESGLKELVSIIRKIPIVVGNEEKKNIWLWKRGRKKIKILGK